MRNILDKKRGQAMPVIITIAVVVIAFAVLFGAWKLGAFGQSVTISPEVQAAAGSCQTEPYVTIVATDEINPGTIVPAVEISAAVVNDKFFGAITTGSSGTKFALGDKVDSAAVNGTNYGAVLFENGVISKCGLNELQASMLKLSGAPTIKIRNSAGTELTDNSAGGAVNQSSSSTSIVTEYRFTTPSNEGAESMTVVVEASNNTEIQTINLKCSGISVSDYRQNKPDFHSTEGTLSDSIFKSFTIEGFGNDGTETVCSLTFDPKTGETMGAGDQTIFTTNYFAQAFADVDGTIKVDIQNSDGTAKHIAGASTDYDFSIGNI